jgi:hypothetical protein
LSNWEGNCFLRVEELRSPTSEKLDKLNKYDAAVLKFRYHCGARRCHPHARKSVLWKLSAASWYILYFLSAGHYPRCGRLTSGQWHRVPRHLLMGCLSSQGYGLIQSRY